MKQYNIHPLEAIAYLRTHRPLIDPQVGMVKALLAAHTRLNLQREESNTPQVSLNIERISEYAKSAAGRIHHKIQNQLNAEIPVKNKHLISYCLMPKIINKSK